MSSTDEKPRPQSSAAWSEDAGERPDASSSDKGKKEEKPEAKPKPAFPKRKPGDPQRIKFAADVDEAEQEEEDEEEENQNPAFYLAAATVVGMFCFCTFVFAFIFRYGEFEGLPIWLGTFIGGCLCFFAPFFYYCCTSNHPSKCCGRLLDGFLGAWPFLLPGTGMFFLYAVLGIAIKNVAGGRLEDKILIYMCVPVFLLLWLPSFVGLMYLQGTEIEKEREEKEALARQRGTRRKRNKVDLGRGKWKVSLTVFRRLVIATVVSCCVTSYGILPLFGLGWAIIGSMMLWEIHPAIPLSILGVLIIFIVLCAIFFRGVLFLIGRFFKGFYMLPISGWAPRATGTVLPKYDNSLTLDRRLDHHNSQVEEMEKLRSIGKNQEAEQLIQEIRSGRQTIQSMGAEVIEVPMVEEEGAKSGNNTRRGGGAAGERNAPSDTRAVDVESM